MLISNRGAEEAHRRNIQVLPNMIAKGKLPRLALLVVAGVLLVLVTALAIRSQHKRGLDYGKAEPLNSAIQARNVSKIAALIDGDKTILRATGAKSTTPLNYAIRAGETEIVELLLTKGADVNLPDDIGFTPLHCAAGRGDKPIVEFLLAKGASVNTKAYGGVTPLHMAVNSRRKEVVELLVGRGADLTARSITPTFVGSSLDDLNTLYTPAQWAKKLAKTK
jgi:ankyrin repeat protein